jgi:hypothetical protein
MENVAPLEDSMSLRSSLTKLVGSLSSLRIRPTWAGAAGVVGFLAMSANGCSCGNSSLVPCGDAGEFCICNGLDCVPAQPGTGGGGTGGATTVGTGGSDGGTGGTSGTSGSDGGTGGSTSGTGGSDGGVIGLTCDTTKPCPAPQVCLPDGYCHYPCTDLLDCKHFDNRFTACTDGFCEP